MPTTKQAQEKAKQKINAKKIETKLENYVSPEGISTKQLEKGLWFYEHQQQFKLAGIIILILISAATWSYTIYGLAYYLAKGMSEDDILTKQMLQVSSVGHDYIMQKSAKQLSLGPVQYLPSDGKYDLFTRINNDNPQWWVEFDYYFSGAGKNTDKTHGYILPQNNKYFMALAQEFSAAPIGAVFNIENISWHRINVHQIPDWNNFYQSRLNIATTDVKFTAANGSQALNRLSFNAINNTAFNYWETGFTIVISGYNGVAYINHSTINSFLSGQIKPIEINWAGAIGSAQQVEIFTEINIMDSNAYMPYQGGIGQPSGNQ